ncbi:outer membrane protein assembly factor BamB [Luteimonas sp. e5]
MRQHRPILRMLGIAACVLALAGCSTVKGWFTSKKTAETKPAALVEFSPTVQAQRVWSVNLGKGEGRSGARQHPVVVDGRVYAAAAGATVRAIDLASGQTLWSWSGDKNARYAGGPGAGDGLVVVGDLDGEVVALDADSGSERWRARVQNEVIAAPAVGGGLVFVRSNDGRVTAFDAASGQPRWTWQADMPALTVRGNSAMTLGPGYLFLGTDGGKAVALSANEGAELWEFTVAQAEGRSELDRMNDVDGAPLLNDATLYASSFKGQTMAFEAPTGRPLWAQMQGGGGGLGLGHGRLALTDAQDVVWALDAQSGAPMWKQPSYPRRQLTAPAVQGSHVVVGDAEGYLHWFSLEDGRMSARSRAGRKPIRAQPVTAGDLVLVQDIEGGLSAWRLGQ